MQTSKAPAALLSGKKGLILGVANRDSIAWAAAQASHMGSADLFLTYQERVRDDVEPMAAELGAKSFPCDVASDESLDSAFEQIAAACGGKLDFVVHSLAFTKRQTLAGRYMDLTRDQFALANEISAYSLTAVAQRAEGLLKANGGGSIITLSYLGAERAIPYYNVMGVAKAALESSVRYLALDLGKDNIRVNAVSAGAIMTRAGGAIQGMAELISLAAASSPLARETTQQEVGDAVAFLASDMASGISGQTIYVDCGYSSVGAPGLKP